MYTWGYIKEAIFAKLDLTEQEALEQNLINKIPFYANEALTQICSTIKPNYKFFDIDIYTTYEEAKKYISKKYNVDLDTITEKTEGIAEQAAYKEYSEVVTNKQIINSIITMPDDFISFGDDINTVDYTNVYGVDIIAEEVHDDRYTYHGYNQIVFKKSGTYHMSYNARWIIFTHTLKNNEVLQVPTDILDTIPSYVASQYYKLTDEIKASLYRNEFELLFARIDQANSRTTKSIIINGGW